MFRADNIRNKITSGTGLGLYIAKAIVRQSGGEITFESQENKGTSFYVSLPVKSGRISAKKK
jgi:signal transduction histidine kinase